MADTKMFCSPDCEFADDPGCCKKKCPSEDFVFCKILEDFVEKDEPCLVEQGVYMCMLKRKKAGRKG